MSAKSISGIIGFDKFFNLSISLTSFLMNFLIFAKFNEESLDLFLSNIFTDLNLSDMETCYKAFRSEIIKNIRIEEKRFGFEPEITAKISKRDYRIYEVGISYYGRTYKEGKKIGWRDGFQAIWCILKYNLLR